MIRVPAEAYHAERIRLFGSAARGDPGADSDDGFMILAPDGTPEDVLGDGRAYQAFASRDMSEDAGVGNKFDRRLHRKAWFPFANFRDGGLQYGT